MSSIGGPSIIGGFGTLDSSAPFMQADLAVRLVDGVINRVRCEEVAGQWATTLSRITAAVITRDDWEDLKAAGEAFEWPEVDFDPNSAYSFWIFGDDFVVRAAIAAVSEQTIRMTAGGADRLVCLVDVREHASWRDAQALRAFEDGVALLRSGRPAEALVRARMVIGLSSRWLGKSQALLIACHRALGDDLRADGYLSVAAKRSRGFLRVTEEWIASLARPVARDEHPDYELVEGAP